MAASVAKAASILEPRAVVDHEAGRLEVGGHLRQLELHRLELGDRLPELPPFLHVLRGRFERASRDPSICAPMPMRPSFRVSIAIL